MSYLSHRYILKFKIKSLNFFCVLCLLFYVFTNGVLTQVNNEVSISVLSHPMLLISTLDGSLFVLEKHTGEIKWKLLEEPLIKLPDLDIKESNYTLNFKDPLLLPDPKDGSLYIYNGIFINKSNVNNGKHKLNYKNKYNEEARDILEKMPFTLNELISNSPCRSTTGYLYTGKKSDSWLILDATTGTKIKTLNSESPICPKNDNQTSRISNKNILMIGKTKFHLNIFNTKSHQKHWNLTLVDYSSTAALTLSQSNYDLVHLTSASSGKIVTFDLESNQLLWKNQLSSPIISIFEFDLNLAGLVKKIPFTTVGTNYSKKNKINSNKTLTEEGEDLDDYNKLSKTYYSSVYLGKNNELQTIYMVSSIVETDKKLISSKFRRKYFPLIEGPEKDYTSDKDNSKFYTSDYYNLLIYGFYEFPDYTNVELFPQFLLSSERQNLITDKFNQDYNNYLDSNQSNKINFILMNNDMIMNTQFFFCCLIISFFLVITTIMTFLSVYFKFKYRKTQKLNQVNIDFINWKTVGKISFNQNHVIGRGSSGTFIYKGLFESRQEVAVKRVISELFVVTDREIELLSKLQHPNLVRYFITEFDGLFRYIAIELAEISLADYIEKIYFEDKTENLNNFSDFDILHGTCLGISHLHSLNIVHRDIKPQNILLTSISTTGKRKVLITDFGLSKVIADTHSISIDHINTKNVILGTEGWIAPEIIQTKINKNIKNTLDKNQNEKKNINDLNDKFSDDYLKSKAIDIFSLGCVFYYVLSKGKHPYGESILRQTNILENKCCLNEIKKEDQLIQYNLVEKMLSYNPKDRPIINSVLSHPFFWNESKQLNFLLCVSDRIEKENDDSDILKLLEINSKDVVRDDWKRHISVELSANLKLFRSYKGTRVKDLLRALRNKKHHYRELNENLQKSLGSIPIEFCKYFTSRFPRLLIHSYIQMQKYSKEDIFIEFYEKNCDLDFKFNSLPISNIKWYKSFDFKSNILKTNTMRKDDNEISFRPNVIF